MSKVDALIAEAFEKKGVLVFDPASSEDGLE